MRANIRNLKTGKYVSVYGWTTERRLARDFEGAADALAYRFDKVLRKDLQVILQLGDEPSEKDVTLEHPAI